jgi:ATP phosphoribosyltransferase regulatory subunit
VRPTDVPVFVSYGGVDCAICGKDSLTEAALEVVEMADLGFGACRFVVAEPAQAAGLAEDAYQRLGVLRVATKYPRITAAYYRSVGVQVEIVKMHGNIELAPLCGMADRIVDITATGATLRENNLVILDEVLASTARFVGNPASVRIDPRVRALAARLEQES